MEIATILLTCLHFESDLEMHRDLPKMRPKTQKLKLREMVEGRSGQVHNVSTDSPKLCGPISDDISPASVMPEAGKISQSAAFSRKSWGHVQMSDFVLFNTFVFPVACGRRIWGYQLTWVLRTFRRVHKKKMEKFDPTCLNGHIYSFWLQSRPMALYRVEKILLNSLASAI